jgi:hypothetical protein
MSAAPRSFASTAWRRPPASAAPAPLSAAPSPPRVHVSRTPPSFLPCGRPPLSPSLFFLLHQGDTVRSPRLPSPSCLLSDSERPTTSPYSPLPRHAIPVHRRPPVVVELCQIDTALPCSGGSHLRACPLLSLKFMSWLTSSFFLRCCRSCPRSSMAVVGAHLRQEAPAPPSSTASMPPCTIGEHLSYPPCPAAHTYYHGASREDLPPVRSLVSRCALRRRGLTGRVDHVHCSCYARRASTLWAESAFGLGLPGHLWPVKPSRSH